jgi:hypothetical protein
MVFRYSRQYTRCRPPPARRWLPSLMPGWSRSAEALSSVKRSGNYGWSVGTRLLRDATATPGRASSAAVCLAARKVFGCNIIGKTPDSFSGENLSVPMLGGDAGRRQAELSGTNGAMQTRLTAMTRLPERSRRTARRLGSISTAGSWALPSRSSDFSERTWDWITSACVDGPKSLANGS